MLTRFRTAIFILVSATTLLVTGCGFHLRGQVNLPEILQTMYIDNGSPEINVLVERTLRFSDIQIAESPTGVAVLDLETVNYEKTVNTTDNQGKVSAYRLRYTLTYKLYSPEGQQMQADTITTSESLQYNAEQELLAEREEDFLKEDMEQELVNRLMRRISRVNQTDTAEELAIKREGALQRYRAKRAAAAAAQQ